MSWEQAPQPVVLLGKSCARGESRSDGLPTRILLWEPLARRGEIAANAKCDSTANAVASLVGRTLLFQVIGINVIEGAELNANVAKEPEDAAAARSG